MTIQEQEYEKSERDNAKLRKELNAYIKHENELVHITMSPARWREFVEYLKTKKENEKN